MAELTSNSLPFEVLVSSEERPRTGIEVVSYSSSDPFTALDVIPFRTSPKFLDEIGGPGGGSFQIHRKDPKLAETPDLLDYRNVFKCLLDGKAVGAFIGTQKSGDFVSSSESSGEYIECSGSGLRGWFHDAVVAPWGGLRTDSQESRAFSFASERGSWYVTSQWVAPVSVQQYNLDPNPNPFGTAPAEWPDAPDAHWIWGLANDGKTVMAPAGINYFRYEFDISGLSGAESYAVFASGKDEFDVYLDGQIIVEAREDDSYAQTWRADFDLTNGHHVLAARVRTKGTGAAGFIAAFFKAGDATANTAATLISVTSPSTWVVNAYPDPAPGWSPGEILLTLLAEAEARGVRFPTWLTPTFTASVDSDGASWDRFLDWSFDIGTDYYEVVEKLEELVCDLWIDPETYELHLYGTRGVHRDVQSDVVQPVKFEVGRNVSQAAFEGTSDIKNTLMVRDEDGWRLVADAETDSIEDYGRVEGFLSTGASSSVSGDVAERVFRNRATPSVSATYEVLDTDDARPWADFFPGDWVLAPSEEDDSVLTTRRVMSMSVAEDSSTGAPVFAVEFDTISEDLATRFDRWLRTAGDGTLGGTLANASTGGGSGGSTPSSQSVATGPAGLQGPRGFPGFAYRGIWQNTEIYAISDVVSLDGDYWVAKASTSGTPGVSSSWDRLILSPSTTPAIGATFYLTSTWPAPVAATAVPWTGEAYKSNITHAASGTGITIQDPGPYLVCGEFTITASAVRDYALQVNGVTVATARTDGVVAGSTLAVAVLPGLLLNLLAGDVLQVVSSGAAVHSVLGSSETWLSVAKVTGARGEQGPAGDTGPSGQGFTWRGAWVLGIPFTTYDVVVNEGATYVCTSAHVATDVTAPGTGASWGARWTLMAQRGEVGPSGANFIILGTLPDEVNLPVSGSPGDAYLIDQHLWIWSVLAGAWEDVGTFGGGSGGGGSSGGGGYAAGNFVLTTPAILDGQTYMGGFAFNGAEVSQILMISADAPCRVRFYATQSQQTTDEWRSAGVDPVGNHGVLSDSLLVPGKLSTILSPCAVVFNATDLASPVRVTVTNLSGSERTLTVTVLTKGMAGSAQGGQDAATYIVTTPTLASGDSDQSMLAMSSAEVHQALALSASIPCRVRFYASTAQRTSDLNRAVGTDPTGNHGVLLDVELTPGKLEYVLAPSVSLFSAAGFGAVPATITNKAGVSSAVTVSLLAKGI